MIKLLKYGNINIIFVNHTLFQTFNVISSEHVTKVSELIATISFISQYDLSDDYSIYLYLYQKIQSFPFHIYIL